jgi:hypothetical protein
MATNLRHFEAIDGLHSQLIRIDFMTCADPRGYVRLSSRLLDACLDAGMSHDEPDHHEWAAGYLCRALVSA